MGKEGRLGMREVGDEQRRRTINVNRWMDCECKEVKEGQIKERGDTKTRHLERGRGACCGGHFY